MIEFTWTIFYFLSFRGLNERKLEDLLNYVGEYEQARCIQQFMLEFSEKLTFQLETNDKNFVTKFSEKSTVRPENLHIASEFFQLSEKSNKLPKKSLLLIFKVLECIFPSLLYKKLHLGHHNLWNNYPILIFSM